MDTHGGLLQPLIWDQNGEPSLKDIDANKSFRNLFETPEPEECFKVHGQDPRDDLASTDRMFAKLAHAMHFSRNVWSTPLQLGRLPEENTSIPAGYTYLLQLLTHDLLLSSEFSPRPDGHSELRNHRSFALDLDTLYGTGPAACPFAYAKADQSGFRTRLRLSRIRESYSQRNEHLLYRDIGRGKPVEDNSTDLALKTMKDEIDNPVVVVDGAPTALIADPRNDDNSNISQLLTVFIWLHNTVMDILEADHGAGDGPEVRAHEHRFIQARQIVTGIYHRIIRFDLLPRILDPRILRLYAKEQRPILDSGHDPRIPLEFSHAALRFGHAMIRKDYTMNGRHGSKSIETVLQFTSERRGPIMPLDEEWIIEWSRFFEIGDPAKLNYSRRIGPSLNDGLVKMESLGGQTLAHRDLERGSYSNLWSVPALIRKINSMSPEIVALSPLLSKFDATASRIAAWLEKQNPGYDLTLSPEEIASLSEDPPLFFFLLFEAMEQEQGERLGVLGSFIIAETIFRHLTTTDDEEIAQIQWTTGFEEVRTMPDLIRTLAERSGLESAKPEFI